MREENPTVPPKLLYSPPAPDALEAFARQVCQGLGTDFTTPEIVEGFSAYLQVAAEITARHLSESAESS